MGHEKQFPDAQIVRAALHLERPVLVPVRRAKAEEDVCARSFPQPQDSPGDEIRIAVVWGVRRNKVATGRQGGGKEHNDDEEEVDQQVEEEQHAVCVHRLVEADTGWHLGSTAGCHSLVTHAAEHSILAECLQPQWPTATTTLVQDD